jgi:hypothetical protein
MECGMWKAECGRPRPGALERRACRTSMVGQGSCRRCDPAGLYRRLLIGALVLAFSCAGLAASSQPVADVIDRVLALVAGQVITLSDVRAATEIGLIDSGIDSDPVRGALHKLIDRELMLSEVERYSPPEPEEAAVDGRLALLANRFGSPEGLRAAMVRVGMTEPRLRGIVRDDLRIEAYLQQRFTAAAQPTDEEVARYYTGRREQFVSDGRVPELPEIQQDARRRLTAERREEMVENWLSGLRRRSEIVIMYRPPR